MEDTLVFGAALLTLINRCDRVKAACVAQLVNVIGLIMTETGGRAWRQPIFYPFQHARAWARGTVLDMRLTCGTFAAGDGERFPDLVSAAVLADDGKSLALFCVNRNFDQAIDVEIDLRGLELSDFLESRVLKSDDLSATNTADDPVRVRPETAQPRRAGRCLAPDRSACIVERVPVRMPEYGEYSLGLTRRLSAKSTR